MDSIELEWIPFIKHRIASVTNPCFTNPVQFNPVHILQYMYVLSEHWIATYPLDKVILSLNNWGLRLVNCLVT